MSAEFLTENDLKIRKQWLIVLIISAIVDLFNESSKGLLKLSLNSLSWERYIDSYTTALILLFLSYVMYHCAYKKPGTKLLTLSIILARIQFVGLFIHLIWDQPTYTASILQVPLLLSYALDIWGYFLNVKMRKINNRLKAHGVLKASQ